jgi:NAD(P)-dependent dehydrogenase (short-subunit alcohol dehydrogenase family)
MAETSSYRQNITVPDSFDRTFDIMRPAANSLGRLTRNQAISAFREFGSEGVKCRLKHWWAAYFFTLEAAKEFGPRGISVNAVAPGPMDTPFSTRRKRGCDRLSPIREHERQAHHIPDIVPIITFLVTDGWWATGQTIFANGG